MRLFRHDISERPAFGTDQSESATSAPTATATATTGCASTWAVSHRGRDAPRSIPVSHRSGTVGDDERRGGERGPERERHRHGTWAVAAAPRRHRQRVPVRQRGAAFRGRAAAAARRERFGQVDGDEHAAAVPAHRPPGPHRRGRRAERDPQVVDAQRARRRPAGRLPVDRVRAPGRVPHLRLRHQGQPAVGHGHDLVVRHVEAARNRRDAGRARQRAAVGGRAARRPGRRRGVRRPPPSRLPAGGGAPSLRRGIHRPAHRADQRRAQPTRRRPDRRRSPGPSAGCAAATVRTGAGGGRPTARRPRGAPPQRRRVGADLRGNSRSPRRVPLVLRARTAAPGCRRAGSSRRATPLHP